jgi:hypothetical protein
MEGKTMTEGQKPIRTSYLGNMKLSSWENKKEDYTIYSHKLEKSYKDETTGEWKKTESLNDKDLTNGQTLIQKELMLRIKTK